MKDCLTGSGNGSSPYMKNFESSAKRGSVPLRAMELLRAAATWMLIAQLAVMPFAAAAGDKKPEKATAPVSAVKNPGLKAMQSEITRASAGLGKTEQPPYYLGYTGYELDFMVLVGA